MVIVVAGLAYAWSVSWVWGASALALLIGANVLSMWLIHRAAVDEALGELIETGLADPKTWENFASEAAADEFDPQATAEFLDEWVNKEKK